jgi:hypothetical protein
MIEGEREGEREIKKMREIRRKMIGRRIISEIFLHIRNTIFIISM